MSVSAFPYGTFGPHGRITAINESVFESRVSPLDARAGVQYETDGDTTARKNTGDAALTAWLTPSFGAPGTYEIRCNNVGDALKAGSDSLNTWLALSTQRHWEIEETGTGTKAATLTIDFRKGTGPIIKTVTVTLDIEVTP